jgi:translocator protein
MNRSIRKISAKLKWWQVGLLSVAISFLGKLAGGISSNTEIDIYTKKLKQAPWAPPAWLFGPAWTINNFFLLLGLQKLINETEDCEER